MIESNGRREIIKLNILNNCVKIATLSTCILNANDNKDSSETEFKLTDNFGIKTSYSYSIYDLNDVTAPCDVHWFNVDFFRDGQLLDRSSFATYAPAYSSRSLCDQNKEMQFRLEWLRTAKPDILEKVRFMANKMNLSKEEIIAIEQKAIEIENIVNEMNKNIGRGR